jgi:hypothetical protein
VRPLQVTSRRTVQGPRLAAACLIDLDASEVVEGLVETSCAVAQHQERQNATIVCSAIMRTVRVETNTQAPRVLTSALAVVGVGFSCGRAAGAASAPQSHAFCVCVSCLRLLLLWLSCLPGCGVFPVVRLRGFVFPAFVLTARLRSPRREFELRRRDRIYFGHSSAVAWRAVSRTLSPAVCSQRPVGVVGRTVSASRFVGVAGLCCRRFVLDYDPSGLYIRWVWRQKR